MKVCKLCDCTEANNVCKECKYNKECDWVWIQKLWNNTPNLSACLPQWVKPDIRAGHAVTITGINDFCFYNAPIRKDTITIQDIAVAEEARGQGLSKKLILGLMQQYDRDVIAKCIKGSSAESFWKHLGAEKLGEELSKQSTVCTYYLKNNEKSQEKEVLF